MSWRKLLFLPPGAFRLVLAFAVVLSHVSRADVGRLAVLLFFYLSGYWTALIWREKFGEGSTLRFYAARYLRIAPLYLLVMAASALLRQQPLHFENFSLLGVATSHRDPTGVSWSLDIELQFYLLLPLIAGLIAAAPAWVTIGVSILIGALGLGLEASAGLSTVAKYLPVFVAGSLTFAKAWKPTAKRAALSLLGFGAITLLTTFTPFLDKTSADPFDQDIWALVWLLPLLPYVAHSLTIRSSRLDRHLGNLSFPLYLVHFPLIAVAAGTFGGSLPVKLLAVSAAVLLAVVIYVCIDRPLDWWRVKLIERSGRKSFAETAADTTTAPTKQ